MDGCLVRDVGRLCILAMGRALGVSVSFLYRIHTHSAHVWDSDEGWERVSMAWHSDLYDCITVTVTC